MNGSRACSPSAWPITIARSKPYWIKGVSMADLISGEYDVLLNGVNIHYTIRGKGPVLIAHSGGPGADARDWDDFAKIDDFLTIVALHPRGSGLSGPAAG